jgi:hypothetical protein
MRDLFARLYRWLWIRNAVRILTRHPFCWSRRQAASYAGSLYHLHIEEGFTAAEAIECDRQYWEG